MCDIYEAKCEFCQNTISFHIGGFRFPRTDIKVYCYRHYKKAPEGAVVYKFTRKVYPVFYDVGHERGERWAVIAPEGHNHPNYADGIEVLAPRRR